MRVELLPPDPDWKSQFQQEADQIARVLGDIVVGIHHIGSTAILASSPNRSSTSFLKSVTSTDWIGGRLQWNAWGTKDEANTASGAAAIFGRTTASEPGPITFMHFRPATPRFSGIWPSATIWLLARMSPVLIAS